ncbi:hypothetical protein TNCV_1824801 [Trichonephila clavipes]|nr:hypothetical protein TNCV_1824801 [Trichonephila clavipes]
MSSGHSLPQVNLNVQGGTQEGSHNVIDEGVASDVNRSVVKAAHILLSLIMKLDNAEVTEIFLDFHNVEKFSAFVMC